MKAFDLIARYFPDKSTPTPDGIADAARIKSAAFALVRLLLGLRILKLTPAQRRALFRKGDPDQRRRSQTFCKFLAGRPDFAARCGIDPARYQWVIDKDEAFDILVATLVYVRQAQRDSTLVLSAWLSEQTGDVLRFSQQLWDSNDQTDPSVLLADFAALDYRLGEYKAKQQEQRHRHERNRAAKPSTAAPTTGPATKEG